MERTRRYHGLSQANGRQVGLDLPISRGPIARACRVFNPRLKSVLSMLPTAFSGSGASHIFATFSRYMNVLPWILALVGEDTRGRLVKEKGSFVTDCVTISCQAGGLAPLGSEGGAAPRLCRAGRYGLGSITYVLVALVAVFRTALEHGGSV